ncbi:VOC family protein [Kineosporia babensis]|uniref:VOC family protein n=1 Tax=Kineosporia babensis TaxID=499548 RepID=A0A9X1NP62_9ACTN|nr:VOC family protein [Kineosporia babensis]MCD5316668.1 VOC family protein [Kineosporia babensis]
MNHQPPGYTTVAPWVVTPDSSTFLDFTAQAFGAEEIARVSTENGGIGHFETRIGDSVVLGFDRLPEWPEMPSLLRVFVADPDATFERAVAAGARVITPLAEDAFGQRGGRLRDPFGNVWWVATVVEEMTEDEMWRRLALPEQAEVMRVAQETLDTEFTDRAGRSSTPIRPPR